ncbi:MAG: histidine--tRNA ligase, partial [Chlamydiia bacterium]|nr:histidine--tRNA ligase [Chlamydiia bacterium]
AFIENRMADQQAIQKIFYIAPMFRYERPQAGRYRQHHQFGVEAIGSSLPVQDVEVMDLLYTLLRRLGLREMKVCLNSLGDKDTRKAYRNALRDYLKPHFSSLSEDSQSRFESNPLRILDSKAPQDKALCVGCPSLLDYLSSDARAHFDEVQLLLSRMGIPFSIDARLVRGLDYYNGIVFEVVSSDLGAQNSVAGGGRYDGLLDTLGGQDLPACGFGCGMERLLQVLLKSSDLCPPRPRPLAVLVPLGEEEARACAELSHTLRQEGLPVGMDMTGKKLKHAMRYANAVQARYVLVVGSEELGGKQIEIKDMDSGSAAAHCAWQEVPDQLRQLWTQKN